MCRNVNEVSKENVLLNFGDIQNGDEENLDYLFQRIKQKRQIRIKLDKIRSFKGSASSEWDLIFKNYEKISSQALFIKTNTTSPDGTDALAYLT